MRERVTLTGVTQKLSVQTTPADEAICSPEEEERRGSKYLSRGTHVACQVAAINGTVSLVFPCFSSGASSSRLTLRQKSEKRIKQQQQLAARNPISA